ncbi:MAG: CaiB/BaiF CoA transferase family protein [Alphaproteobacteria bacterium]
MPTTSLQDTLIVELGDRIAAGACGSLLAELGATVVFVETAGIAAGTKGKWAYRPAFAANKLSLALDPAKPADRDLLARVLRAADAVVTTSDANSPWKDAVAECDPATQIVCDVSAFGSDGPMAGRVLSDPLIQALSGVSETSGLPEGPPTVMGAPFMELSTGVYAAAGIVAALRVRRISGKAQNVEVSLFDTGINSLTTFLPGHFSGGRPKRMGNSHSLVVPWSAYEAKDGWVIVCCPSEIGWRKLCGVMGQPDLPKQDGFKIMSDLVANRDKVDAIVQEWVSQQTVEECVDVLMKNGISAGPIARLDQLENDPNVKLREVMRRIPDRATGETVRVPGVMMPADGWDSVRPDHVPAVDEGREAVATLLAKRSKPAVGDGKGAPELPLAGIRVLELGQFTTAPLAARQLATLGADVIKVEADTGDAGRQWPPHRNGLSLFFVLQNSGKRAAAVDLTTDEGKEALRALVRTADVLVENMKPGSLGRLGFSAKDLHALNPRLVYCPISGFGVKSAFPGRAAVDTVAQAMGGIMDITRCLGTPVKAGISACDIIGGQFSLLAILSALELRERTGKGVALDLSMQDSSAWITHPVWNGAGRPASTTVACKDGYVEVEGAPDAAMLTGASNMTRDDLIARLAEAGVPAVPVQTVGEAAAYPQTLARDLLPERTDANGTVWPIIRSAIRLSLTPPCVVEPIGEARVADQAYLEELGVRRSAAE